VGKRIVSFPLHLAPSFSPGKGKKGKERKRKEKKKGSKRRGSEGQSAMLSADLLLPLLEGEGEKKEKKGEKKRREGKGGGKGRKRHGRTTGVPPPPSLNGSRKLGPESLSVQVRRERGKKKEKREERRKGVGNVSLSEGSEPCQEEIIVRPLMR